MRRFDKKQNMNRANLRLEESFLSDKVIIPKFNDIPEFDKEMMLTREEQKNVVRMVMESHQVITLTEAKSNNIREEMKLNLQFYNELKEGFLNEDKTNLQEGAGMFGTFLSVLGNIKDFLSGLKIIKDFSAWVKNFLSKLWEKIKPIIDKFIPKEFQYIVGQQVQIYNDAGKAVVKFTKWLYDTLSYKGLAKLFAMIRFRTFKPSDEQKECMHLAAKKVYKWIIIALVAFFIIKIGWAIIGALAVKSAVAGTAFSTASLGTTLAPIKGVLVSIGHGSIWTGMFSVLSAGIKIKQANDVEKQIQSIEDENKSKELDSINDAWGMCPVKNKKV